MSIDVEEPLGSDLVSSDEMARLMKAIRRIARASDLGSRSLQKSVGLTGPQLAVLSAIGRLGETSTKTLADQVDVSAATVVTILDNLERDGLVTRHRSGEDRRIVHSRLTAAGMEVLARVREPLGGAFARRFNALSPQKRLEIVAGVTALADIMSSDGAGRPSGG